MARRGRKVGVWLVVVFVLLGGLLFAADRVSAWAAERTIADKSGEQMRRLGVSSSEPEVTVGGFPFLTQVADGTYQEITIVLRNVEKEGIRLPVLDVHAMGVKADLNALVSGDGQVTADRITGTATVGYDSVQALVAAATERLGASGGGSVSVAPGLTVSEQDGKLRLRLPMSIAGLPFTAVGLAVVGIDAGKVRVAVTELRAEGVTLPPAAQRLLDSYRQRLVAEVALPPLPFRLKIDDVSARPDGLAITASARGVPLTG